jgi:hemerythrin-like domain-containing protein
MRLPNAERAVVPIEKIRDYCLDPEHDEGKHKAKVFRALFGFTQEDAEGLQAMIVEAAQMNVAVQGKTLSHGQMYVLDFPAQSLRGEVTIRTAWIVERNTDFARLVTCYVK